MKRNEAKKLNLKKETIQNMEIKADQMGKVVGGAAAAKWSIVSLLPVICA